MKKNTINKRHIATEKQSFDEIIDGIPNTKKWVEVVFSRLKRVGTIHEGARVLDIGAGVGRFMLACSQLGYQCEGIEPWDEARLNAIKLLNYFEIPAKISPASAEELPFEDETFDVVHASSVIEHVIDAQKTFEEAYRVLKYGGIFWFNTASSMSPAQNEIRGFPLFGWYPDPVKRKVMYWVKDNKPHLIGYTETPAIHWFTPWKAQDSLQKCGFQQIYDRWDLRGETEGGAKYQFALRVIRSNVISKSLADIVVPGCSYAAIK